ncbi:microtubule associated protein [Panaeolus papilionaceus]|nr:microtubule associated protein [Panaeolus papilionaceus]
MDGPPPQEEDFTVIPIPDRLIHKNWKARVSAYEALIKIFENSASDTDPAFKAYINNTDLVKKFVTDSNAVAQEKGVECTVALVKFAGETAAKTREGIVPALVDKCLGSARAGTKNQAIELILQYTEVENGGAGVNDLLSGLGAKQPKAVAGCVVALKEVVRLFGTTVTPSPPILKALPKVFAHSDKTVRAEGTNLAHALYQYLGPGIEPWLADLKPVQVKELKDAFETMEKDGKGYKSLKAERLTRSAAREAEAAGDEPGSAAEDSAESAVPDPRAFAEAVDIISSLPASFYTNLKSSKWKERKEALDDLQTLLKNTPRIKDSGEIGELSKSLAHCIAKDANINCVMVAANCLEEMAKAMMDSFTKYRESILPPMLERLKERKANVTDAIGAALDAIFATTTLADTIPDLDASLKSKNPQVKEGTLKFLGRSLSTATSPLQQAQIKPLAETLAGLLEDGFEGARNEAATCMGTLMKMVGERPLNAIMDTLADVRKAKVKEAFEKATTKCKAGGAPARAAPPAATATKKPPVASKPASKKIPEPDEAEEMEPPKKPAAKPLTAKPPVKKVPAVVAPSSAAPAPKKLAASAPPKTGGKPAAPAAPGALDTVKYKHTPEDADALAAEMIPAQIMADFGDANWKVRLAATEEMQSWVEKEAASIDAEVLVRAIAKKGWSEKNFQVSAKLYVVLDTLAQQCPSFGRSCIALSVPHLTEKLGDMKLKKPAGDTLLTFAEKASLQFVLHQAYEPLSKQKAPKVLADAIVWVNLALTDFGIAGVSLKALIDFLKMTLGNSNAAVRTSATKTLVTVKLFAGSSIKDLLEDLNPQLLNTITSEFDKVEGQTAPEPSRTSADLANLASQGSSGKGAAPAGDPLDDLFPRVEIDGLLKGTTILADAKSDAWKTKKEALEALQAILDQGSNKRLKPSIGEIAQVLKARVVDANKAVQTLALDIVSRIATGMGKHFDKQTRFFVAPICTVLADQKAPIRSAALQTLTAIGTACEGVDSMIPGLTTGLESTNPLQRASIFQWMVEWFKEHPPTSQDLKPWVPTVISCLDDRNGDVRKAAQALLPTIIMGSSFDYVMQQTGSLKPASRSTALPLIQAARPASTTVEPPMKPAINSKAATPVAIVEEPVVTARSESPALAPAAGKPVSKLGGVRRKLPQGLTRPESRAESVEGSTRVAGLKKPLSAPIATPSAKQTPAAQTSSLIFTNANTELKKSRVAKDASRWVNEGGPTRKDLADLLQSQMEPLASKDLVARLFSHDHNAVNDHILGLGMLSDLYSGTENDEVADKICIANLDLPLKYVSIKAHEPQPNLISRCLDVIEAVVNFIRNASYQLTDNEALCFVPTIIYKLGDPREQVRTRVQQIIRTLPTVYAYSRLFQLLLEHGLKAKVAKTRQYALDELSVILKKSGMGACEPSKAFPAIAATLSDKDPSVRKAALGALSEAYTLVGEKVWSLVGPLSPKDKTQLEERLRRVPGPSTQNKAEGASSIPAPAISRLTNVIPRPASPSVAAVSRLARPSSPAVSHRSISPTQVQARPESPARAVASAPTTNIAGPSSPGKPRVRTMLPSRLGRRPGIALPSTTMPKDESPAPPEEVAPPIRTPPLIKPQTPDYRRENAIVRSPSDGPEDITLAISGILSNDPSRSVDALKKVQRILSVGPDNGPSSPQYRELAEHTEGLIETITLQMAHVFEQPSELVVDENFRLAKHLIQTLNNFCDHAFLVESLTVEILTSLLEELTLRLLETDDSPVKKVKDLSRFINMIILRLFATGRRMSIFRALFALLLQIVKPFPAHGTLPDSKEAKVAELVLKCVWKLARNIPQDLAETHLDPVELFPAIEHFLQSVPPNEWRARATNKVPCGDMPLRTIKVIIQHIVAHYEDDVYELLSSSFDDPSATIVYPYVFRILNSGTRLNREEAATSHRNGNAHEQHVPLSPGSSRPLSPQDTASSAHSNRHSQGHHTSPSSSSVHGHSYSPPTEEPDPDAQLLVIIGHISSETTGALHKEGITELHHFLKAHPHKRPRVEKLLENTGAAFRKYINRALATRAIEDQERDVAVADTLTKLESKEQDKSIVIPARESEGKASSPTAENPEHQERLSRLHDIFQYRSSTVSTGSTGTPDVRTSSS